VLSAPRGPLVLVLVASTVLQHRDRARLVLVRARMTMPSMMLSRAAGAMLQRFVVAKGSEQEGTAR